MPKGYAGQVGIQTFVLSLFVFRFIEPTLQLPTVFKTIIINIGLFQIGARCSVRSMSGIIFFDAVFDSIIFYFELYLN